MKQFYLCGLYQYQLTIVGTKMVWSPLIATWWAYRLLQTVTSWFAGLRQKYNCPFTKYCCSVLRVWNVAHKWTSQRNPQQHKGPPDKQKGQMGWIKGFKRHFIEKSISNDLKGPKRTLGTLFICIIIHGLDLGPYARKKNSILILE